MAVLRKIDVENDENMIKINEIIRKVVTYVDFVAPILQDFEYFEYRFYLRN